MHQYFIYCRKSAEDDDHQALSLESQRRELARYAAQQSLSIVETIWESKSARIPGSRPIFADMLKRIAKGEADGIIAWHPDRLARNAVDGGQVIHYLDTSKLADLRFPTFTFENSPQGKFMLMIMFGHSKYQVDSLSEHVKRGNRMKRELGWLPGFAPIGYLNIRSDSGAKVIGRDPERFPIVKKLWEVFLTGNYSGPELVSLATERFGLRAKRQWRRGGAPMTNSVIYRILRNPFYAGHLVFQGRWYPASHEPMITVAEFNRAQQLLRGLRIRPRRYRFAYTGLITCGSCTSSITAERKVNRYGSSYVYYHCTHGKPRTPCHERAIEEKELERQVISFFADHVGAVGTPVNQVSIRYLLATRASKVTLQNKTIQIELKEPR
jgi:DNA invertase Pin-like site-specific DNA recombinase